MPLPHFTQLYMTGSPGGPGTKPQEPVYTNLFEITFLLPTILQAQGRDPVLLLQQATNVDITTSDLTRDLGSQQQRFKFSTREYLLTPESTDGEVSIKFNVNVNQQLNMEVFTTLKAWYDLLWNSQNGTMNYKSDLIGTIIVNQHDKKGFVIRRITYQNCQLNTIDYKDLDWSQQNIIDSITARFYWDYFIDEYVDGGFTIQPPQVYVS
jgi:hypothetical protein